ncbi:MAG: hypothetical protein ACFFEY_16130 [Candidatus Thorarchaeota archaeon]
MDLQILGGLIYFINVMLSLILTILIIDKLYISKKFSKEKDFHFYNDLFSWEMFYIFIGIENLIKVVSLFITFNYGISFMLLRIRILIFFFPFWIKIVHLEKVMDKITYKKHYFAGIIPLFIVLVLGFTNLPNFVLIITFFGTTFFPFLFFFVFLQNRATKRQKTLKIVFGVIFIGFGYILKPEVIAKFIGISEILYRVIVLTNIIIPIIFIVGNLLIFESFRKEL